MSETDHLIQYCASVGAMQVSILSVLYQYWLAHVTYKGSEIRALVFLPDSVLFIVSLYSGV